MLSFFYMLDAVKAIFWVTPGIPRPCSFSPLVLLHEQYCAPDPVAARSIIMGNKTHPNNMALWRNKNKCYSLQLRMFDEYIVDIAAESHYFEQKLCVMEVLLNTLQFGTTPFSRGQLRHACALQHRECNR